MASTDLTLGLGSNAPSAVPIGTAGQVPQVAGGTLGYTSSLILPGSVSSVGLSTIGASNAAYGDGLTVKAWAGLTNGEIIGLDWAFSAQGPQVGVNLALQRFSRFQQPTLTSPSAFTLTDTATVVVEGEPNIVAPLVATRKYQQWWRGAGALRIDTTTATTATAGTNGAAPAQVAAYLPVYCGTTQYKLPLYAI